MRIALFAETFLPKWDGVANTLCHLLDHLARRGHASLMFAPQGGPGTYASTRIVGLPSFPFPFYPDLKLVRPLTDSYAIGRTLSEFRPDVVHLVNPALLGTVGLRQAQRCGVPVVASYHTDIPGYATQYGVGVLEGPLWAYFRWLHNQADLNLCPSDYTMDELQRHGFERVCLWPHGVDTDRFSPRYRTAEWRERLSGGHPEAPLLIYVGRLAAEKRLDWLRPLLDAMPEVRLAIVGDGPIRPALAQQFANTPTVFAGYLEGQDLSCAYAAGDLFVFPSASETFGNVVLEAMASGLPVVAARAGGPVDLVHDGVNGYLCDASRPEPFCAQVERLVRDPAERARLAAGALRYAQSQSWTSVLDQLLQDYQEVIDRDAARRYRTPRTMQTVAYWPWRDMQWPGSGKNGG